VVFLGTPHYRMAEESGDDDACASVRWDAAGGNLLFQPELSTALCPGPRICKIGKTGLVRSSSSFQVNY